MDQFNFKKYLTEHNLGAFGRFNGYVDLNPINENEGQLCQATINDTRFPGGSDEDIKTDYNLSVIGRTPKGFTVQGSKEDIQSFLDDHAMSHVEINDLDEAEDEDGDISKMFDLSDHESSEDAFEWIIDNLPAGEDVIESEEEETEFREMSIEDIVSTINSRLKTCSIDYEYEEYDDGEAIKLTITYGSNVNEADLPKKPTKIYQTNEDWMNDEINGKRYDDWVAYWEDVPGVIIWIHNKVNTENLYVAITPGWDGPGTPMETIFNSGDVTGEYDSIEEYEFSSFDEYLNAVKFYLDKIDDNIHAGKYKKYGITLGADTSNDKVYEEVEDTDEVSLKDLNYNIVTTPYELEKTWKDMYGEDFKTEYSGAYSYLNKNYKNLNILDLGSVWERMYGEDFVKEYPGISKWLFSNDGRQSSKDKVVPKNDKIYEMGSETLSQEESMQGAVTVQVPFNNIEDQLVNLRDAGIKVVGLEAVPNHNNVEATLQGSEDAIRKYLAKLWFDDETATDQEEINDLFEN